MRLNGKILLTGQGLHTGKNCRLTIEPCNSPEILMCNQGNESLISKCRLSGTNRGSDYIFHDDSRIKTCEHVLSALNGMGIYSDAKITVDGGEMPALDGCSRTLCDEIMRNSEKINVHEAKNINQNIIVYGEDKNRFIAAFPYDCLRITYIVEYKFVGTQIFDYVHDSESYYENISKARTFAMLSDIEYLQAHGMALGGSLDNAVIIGETIQAKNGLHWETEFVRHKILDLIGDLAAVGKKINAHIVAVKAGHELHLKLSEKLRENLGEE